MPLLKLRGRKKFSHVGTQPHFPVAWLLHYSLATTLTELQGWRLFNFEFSANLFLDWFLHQPRSRVTCEDVWTLNPLISQSQHFQFLCLEVINFE